MRKESGTDKTFASFLTGPSRRALVLSWGMGAGFPSRTRFRLSGMTGMSYPSHASHAPEESSVPASRASRTRRLPFAFSPDAVSAEKTTARRRGVRPHSSQTADSPPVTRVSGKPLPDGGAAGLPRHSHPFFLHPRTRHGRPGSFLCPKSHCPGAAPSALPASGWISLRLRHARRGGRPPGGHLPVPLAPFPIPMRGRANGR